MAAATVAVVMAVVMAATVAVATAVGTAATVAAVMAVGTAATAVGTAVMAVGMAVMGAGMGTTGGTDITDGMATTMAITAQAGVMVIGEMEVMIPTSIATPLTIILILLITILLPQRFILMIPATPGQT